MCQTCHLASELPGYDEPELEEPGLDLELEELGLGVGGWPGWEVGVIELGPGP